MRHILTLTPILYWMNTFIDKIHSENSIIMKTKYLLILIILSISCKPENKWLFEFDPTSLTENKITLTRIADDINYIPLDNSIPLGLIYDKIIFINNSIYLSVKDIGILAFNKEGKTLRKIGSIGRGPGEYIYNFSFTVDEKTETVYVLDRGNIIKVYSRTGCFQRSISLQEYGDIIHAIESYNSKLFLSYRLAGDNAKYEWIILDTLGNLIKKKERTIPTFTSSLGGSGGTYKFENLMSYWNSFADTVFSILPDLSEKPSFIIRPGEHRLPRSKVSFSLEQLSQYMLLLQIIETNRFLTIRYFFPNKENAFVLIDKENYKSFLAYLEPESGVVINYIGGIINDFDGGTRFLPKSYFVENGREFMIGLIYPYQVKILTTTDEFKNSAPKYPEKKKELEKLANSLKETDNPVLVLVRLKK
jgi:hypothetical protein